MSAASMAAESGTAAAEAGGARIDAKLQSLHTFVSEHAALLASRKGRTLRASLRQNAAPLETYWSAQIINTYFLMYTHE